MSLSDLYIKRCLSKEAAEELPTPKPAEPKPESGPKDALKAKAAPKPPVEEAPAEEVAPEEGGAEGGSAQFADPQDLSTAESVGVAVATALSTMKAKAQEMADLQTDNDMKAQAIEQMTAQGMQPDNMTDQLFPPQDPAAAAPMPAPAKPTPPPPSQPGPGQAKTSSAKLALLSKVAIEEGHFGRVLKEESQENLENLGGGVASIPTGIMGAAREGIKGIAPGMSDGAMFGGLLGAIAGATPMLAKSKLIRSLALPGVLLGATVGATGGAISGGIGGGALGAVRGGTSSGMRGYEAGVKDIRNQYGSEASND